MDVKKIEELKDLLIEFLEHIRNSEDYEEIEDFGIDNSLDEVITELVEVIDSKELNK